MIRLLYCSQAKSDVGAEEMEKILLCSRVNNKKKDITGVLVHGGGLFVQVLEGPEQNVLRTYVKILDDKRHADSRIIHISPIRDRLFSKWNMGVIARDPLTFEHLAQLRANRLESIHAEAFSKVLRQFTDMLMQGAAEESIREATLT